jgi:hypothetical protein
VIITVLVRPRLCSLAVDTPSIEPSLPSPDPGRETGKEKEDTARTPSPLLLPLCKLPTGVVSPAPTHRAPPPRQNPASTRARPPCPVLLVARRQLRRRATGRRQCRRVGPPLDERTPGSGGGVLPESFPPLAVKPCFLYARRRHRRLLLWTPVSSLPRHRE